MCGTVGNTYTVEGVASKLGEYFVTFKTVLNGVTTVTTTAVSVKGNPFVATYCGFAREVIISALNTMRLTQDIVFGYTTFGG